MSASERLKALDTPLPANLGEWGDEVRKRGAIFLDALPELIAVVEAAEAVRDYEPFEVSKDDFAYDRLVESYRAAVREALAALDAELTTKGER